MPWSQIIASVVDKVLLGGIALIVAHFLKRRIEVFRSRRALEGEFLRERTRRLDELYTLMLDVQAAGRHFCGIALGYVDARRQKPLLLMRPTDLDPAHQKFMEQSAALRRKAAHYGPWIGDHLGQLCKEYECVVRDSVTEQTVDGTHDIDAIDRLESRTRELQAAIVAAIREGAPQRVEAAPRSKASGDNNSWRFAK